MALAAIAVPAPAESQNLPRIAVYVSGDVPDNEKSALGTRMLASLVNSGRYKGIERSSAFLAEIDKEQEKQHSGAIDDGQISELGRMFGVKFVCIAAITPAFGSYQVSARIVDVETAEVAFIGESASPLKTMDDLSQVASAVVKIMFGEQDKQPVAVQSARRPKTGFSAGVGAFFVGDFGGGITWDGENGGQVKMPSLGGGALLFFDVAYAEAFVAYQASGGKWESPNPNTEAKLLDVSRSSFSIGAFAKYPVTIAPSEKIKVFPLLGIEYEATISASGKADGGGEYAFDGVKGRRKASDFSALWVKLGGGVDVDVGEDLYIRAELRYGARTANAFEGSVDDGGEARMGHGVTAKVGAGYRF